MPLVQRILLDSVPGDETGMVAKAAAYILAAASAYILVALHNSVPETNTNLQEAVAAPIVRTPVIVHTLVVLHTMMK